MITYEVITKISYCGDDYYYQKRTKTREFKSLTEALAYKRQLEKRLAEVKLFYSYNIQVVQLIRNVIP